MIPSKKLYCIQENETGYTIVVTDGIQTVEEDMFPMTWELKENAELAEVFENITEVYLPDSVIRIGDNAFEDFVSMKHIRMSNNIESIGEKAFLRCLDLEDISLPESLKSIETLAFFRCASLKTITIPQSVKIIPSHAFDSCISLEEIHLHDEITRIREYAFAGCSQLKRFCLPKKVSMLELGVFEECYSLNAIQLHDDVKEIRDHAFSECLSLKDIKLPNSLLKIGHAVFHHCSALKTIILPEQLTNISIMTFANCTNLTSIILSKNLKFIDSNAFENCSSLKEIVFPDTLNRIGNNAFRYCSNLESAVLPVSVKELNTGVFFECQNLKDIGQNELKYINYYAIKGCYQLTVNLAENGQIEMPFIDIIEKDNANIAIPLLNLPSLETECFQKEDDEVRTIYAITKDKWILSEPLEIGMFNKIRDFLREPDYENLIKIRSVNDKIVLAIAFVDYDTKFTDYIRKHLPQTMEYIGESNDFRLLDYMIDKQILNKRNINKAINCIVGNDYRELKITLYQLKREMGVYDKSDKRLEL